jgi:hypothetical protein
MILPGLPGFYTAQRGALDASSGGSWQTTFSLALPEEGNLNDFSLRTIIPAGSISLSGASIRVTWNSSSGGNLIVEHASIVERDGSTENGTTAPTEILFSGVSGFTISASSTKVSDTLTYSLDETKDYIIISDLGATGHTFFLTGTGQTYFKSGSDSYNVQSPAGFSLLGNTYVVGKVEVFA